ncbi:hypothetical protein D1AOALGA4SA_12937 [Olavius algarvensis Delta 1 endosymbiont]|nr:hypothetical protein D1AOALGA4SA_12937 [Olavius algarvensis Delta 1 endosymbiont]
MTSSSSVPKIPSGASSSRIVPMAVSSVTFAFVPAEIVTLNSSIGSISESPWTSMVISSFWESAGNSRVPEGKVSETKSSTFAGAKPLGVTSQFTVEGSPKLFPLRVTVKVNWLLPSLPSALEASLGSIDRSGGWGSSFLIVPVAVGTLMVAFSWLDRVTVNPSLSSNSVSPWTSMTMSFDFSVGANVRVPEGKLSETKSSTLAGVVPVGVTVQSTVVVSFRSSSVPVRVTVKVNGVVSLSPSSFSTGLGPIDRSGAKSSLEMNASALLSPSRISALPLIAVSVNLNSSSSSGSVSPWAKKEISFC